MSAQRRYPLLLGLALLAVAGAAQDQQGSATLTVNGHAGQAPVIQSNGRSYVDVEALARITNGTLGFQGSRIVLTLPGTGAAVQPSATAPPRPEEKGFSRDFLRAGIEGMSEVREWRAAIENAVRTRNPVEESWVSSYRRSAESGMAIAKAAATTESDKKAVPLLDNQLNNMRQLSDRFLDMRKSASYVPPDSVDNDPLDQKILACAQGLAAMAAPGGQFQDVVACH
ncbi:hypothetical protein [Edaphobacter bradus]|uniref:hypothetical protein n=1 Tax=Edaphobacter bradus TaxID=2259016 RepID=UPI0021E01AAC|nr:hypothetical protein [Edaphobacter bradus]